MIRATAAMLVGLCAAVGFAFTDEAVAAETAARTLVEQMVEEISTTIAQEQAPPQVIKAIEGIFTRYADLPVIARSLLGPRARQLTSAQREAYTKAFAGYMARKYGAQIGRFAGGRVEVMSVRPIKSFYEVRAQAFLEGQNPVSVVFLVSDRSGEARFFDMLIEGISLRITEKAEIGAMLERRRGDFDLFLADLRAAG